MLRELVGNMPLKAKTTPQLVDENAAAAFWPEGYVCTLFCLAVHDAVVKQEFNEPLPQRPPSIIYAAGGLFAKMPGKTAVLQQAFCNGLWAMNPTGPCPIFSSFQMMMAEDVPPAVFAVLWLM
nr:hypothetical protein [Marinicella sp. W31]MDC2878609.1 hypothetical protein [Marinicella sp. W31]